VEALILCRADLTLFDRFGWTALHRAAGLGHVGVVDALVEAGASRKSRDSKGLEPAELAAVAGQDALRTALSVRTSAFLLFLFLFLFLQLFFFLLNLGAVQYFVLVCCFFCFFIKVITTAPTADFYPVLPLLEALCVLPH